MSLAQMIERRVVSRRLTIDVLVFDTTPSTNDVLRAMAQGGACDGTVVVARHQTAGRGRLGRTWASPPGGAYFSLLLRPMLEADRYPLLTLLAGSAVCEALRALGVSAALKWPNDVLVCERKVGGILCEVVDGALIVGIGVNLNSHVADFPHEIQERLTTVREVTGHTVDIATFIADVLTGIGTRLERLEATGDDQAVIEEWSRLSCTLGRHVKVVDGGQVVEGLATGIGPSGALMLETTSGPLLVRAGDVQHVQQGRPGP